MDDDLLDDFIRAGRERDLGVYGIHLYRDGGRAIERRLRSDDRVNLYSVAKTFTSAALGLAEAEGRLTLDDRLLDHLPELRALAADGVEAVTLRQLVTMTSGTSHRWHAVQRIDAANLLHEIVAAPLDLHNPAWHACPLGYPFAESDLFLRTHELARFAQLLLQQGRWGDRQVLPASYVHRMVAETVDTSTVTRREQYTHGYGLGVWIDRSGGYRMEGSYGQFAIVDPFRRAAVTVTAHTERDGELLDAVHQLVLARLS